MEKREVLANRAITICVEAQKSVQKQTVKKGSTNERRREEAQKLISSTIEILERVKTEFHEQRALEYLEEGLMNLYQLELKLRKMKNRFSPILEMYPAIVHYSIVNPAHNAYSEDEQGFFIPFPSPEQVMGFIRQLIH